MTATTDVRVECQECGADYYERPHRVYLAICRSCGSSQVVPANYRVPRSTVPDRGEGIIRDSDAAEEE